ncbi:hypothetical protein LCGC14_0342600 [marine sediment metagenome]|uniref:Chromosomal replication initiator DnaA C-terminal domain-containing protein n=1 Tax=marine sediment metagenome TaxID=412755 RepID=A0A0F9TWA8_9ZZZZ
MKDFILNRVIFYSGLNYDSLKSKCCLKIYCRARQVLIYLLYEYTIMSLKQIGKLLNRDHSTIHHNKKVIINMKTILSYANDPQMVMLRTIEKETIQYRQNQEIKQDWETDSSLGININY